MQIEVQIGGEVERVGDFTAFKATKALELVSEVEDKVRTLVSEAAAFKRNYEAENVMVMDRVEARRQFRPLPLLKQSPLLDGNGEPITGENGMPLFESAPVVENGQAVLGPDPLGHLSEEDWAANGHQLRVPDSPSDNLQAAAMLPLAFKTSRELVLRLLALVLVKNSELERWDEDEGVSIEAELDKRGQALLHQARMDEFVKLAAATAELCREELADPFEALLSSVKQTWGGDKEDETPPAAEPEPMRVEAEEEEGEPETGSSSSSPTSSTPSPGDTTDGDTEPSSTKSASASSSSSVPA